MRPEDRFDEVVTAMITVDGVSHAAGRRLGAQAIRHEGRVIATLTDGRLTVKLPRARVDELVSAGAGVYFDRVRMREWFVLSHSATLPWLDLAKEALAHAQASGRNSIS